MPIKPMPNARPSCSSCLVHHAHLALVSPQAFIMPSSALRHLARPVDLRHPHAHAHHAHHAHLARHAHAPSSCLIKPMPNARPSSHLASCIMLILPSSPSSSLHPSASGLHHALISPSPSCPIMLVMLILPSSCPHAHARHPSSLVMPHPHLPLRLSRQY
eukprot:gene23924-biopygen2095